MPENRNDDRRTSNGDRSSRKEHVRTLQHELGPVVGGVATTAIALASWKLGAEELAFVLAGVAAGRGFTAK